MAVEEHSKDATKNGTKEAINRKDFSETKPEVRGMTSGACELGPPVPPDGGYGWVIMFASFMCNVIVDGVCFSFGIFFLEFLQTFGESKSKTSWVGSVLNGMYLSMGPIVSALANRFGCRAVTMAGGVVACAAYVLSTLSPNINVLIITYGALGGAGFGLIYLPAIVMVGYYFERKRALATGVAVCGSGIGAFVFAPLTEFLISYYGWKGATLIIAGITLQGVVMGALFRPLEPSCQLKTIPPTADGNCDNRIIEKGLEVIPKKLKNEALCEMGGQGNGDIQLKDLLRLKKGTSNNIVVNADKNELSYIRSMHNLCANNAGDDVALKRQRSKSVGHIFPKGLPGQDAVDHAQRVRDICRPLLRKDIFYSRSVVNLPENKSNLSVNSMGYSQSVTSIPSSILANAQMRETGEKPGCLGMCKSMTDTLGTMMDFSLMKNPVFAIYGTSCFLCMTGFFVPFMYLPDDAILKGIPKTKAAFLLSIIGIANTLARVLCGWVSDRSWADCLMINNFALIIGGIATIAAPFCKVYTTMVIYGAVFGSAIAVFVSLRSILMVELIGLDKLTNAFGLVTFCQGLSAFIGAPIAGALFDVTGDYHVSFYFAGTTLLLAGLLCLPLRRVVRWQSEREELLKLGTAPFIDEQSPMV